MKKVKNVALRSTVEVIKYIHKFTSHCEWVSIQSPQCYFTLLSSPSLCSTGFIKRYRYCEYLGKYFCQCCHSGQTSVIPGKVIERWDFSLYPVSNFSQLLLEKMWSEPLFHVDSINPGLYKRVRGLDAIKQGRQQLCHFKSLFEVCKRDTK